ncbi:MAG: hypothetical protein KGI06_05440, partial [Candidatus Micrarchaeota archaeon]|nr:hypothetical protein [Candidatus Micrarchaeota archaeon]
MFVFIAAVVVSAFVIAAFPTHSYKSEYVGKKTQYTKFISANYITENGSVAHQHGHYDLLLVSNAHATGRGNTASVSSTGGNISGKQSYTLLQPASFMPSEPYTTIGSCGSPCIGDSGETVAINILPIGGSYPQNCELYNITGSSQQGGNVTVFNSSTPNTIWFRLNSATGSNTFWYQAICTDSQAFTTHGENISVTVNRFLGTPSLNLSNATIDQRQSTLFTATAYGGSYPYTFNYYILNKDTGIPIAHETYANLSQSSNSFLWTPPASYAGNQLAAFVIVTDGAHTTEWSQMQTINYNMVPYGTIGSCGTPCTITSGSTISINLLPIGGSYPQNCELYNVTGSRQQGSNVLVYDSATPNSV